MSTKRTFTREFKLEAVKFVSERGVKVAQAARGLGISETALVTALTCRKPNLSSGRLASIRSKIYGSFCIL
jgi:transposase-like protein